ACTAVARPRWNRQNSACACSAIRTIRPSPNPSLPRAIRPATRPMPEMQGAQRAAHWRARIDACLEQSLPSSIASSLRLHAAMRHAVLDGGKRMRPLLVYATGTAFGADEEHLDAPAAAVELIHAYSLVHDDLPSMDDDAMRRGKPTVH